MVGCCVAGLVRLKDRTKNVLPVRASVLRWPMLSGAIRMWRWLRPWRQEIYDDRSLLSGKVLLMPAESRIQGFASDSRSRTSNLEGKPLAANWQWSTGKIHSSEALPTSQSMIRRRLWRVRHHSGSSLGFHARDVPRNPHMDRQAAIATLLRALAFRDANATEGAAT